MLTGRKPEYGQMNFKMNLNVSYRKPTVLLRANRRRDKYIELLADVGIKAASYVHVTEKVACVRASQMLASQSTWLWSDPRLTSP